MKVYMGIGNQAINFINVLNPNLWGITGWDGTGTPTLTFNPQNGRELINPNLHLNNETMSITIKPEPGLTKYVFACCLDNGRTLFYHSTSGEMVNLNIKVNCKLNVGMSYVPLLMNSKDELKVFGKRKHCNRYDSYTLKETTTIPIYPQRPLYYPSLTCNYSTHSYLMNQQTPPNSVVVTNILPNTATPDGAPTGGNNSTGQINVQDLPLTSNVNGWGYYNTQSVYASCGLHAVWLPPSSNNGTDCFSNSENNKSNTIPQGQAFSLLNSQQNPNLFTTLGQNATSELQGVILLPLAVPNMNPASEVGQENLTSLIPAQSSAGGPSDYLAYYFGYYFTSNTTRNFGSNCTSCFVNTHLNGNPCAISMVTSSNGMVKPNPTFDYTVDYFWGAVITGQLLYFANQVDSGSIGDLYNAVGMFEPSLLYKVDHNILYGSSKVPVPHFANDIEGDVHFGYKLTNNIYLSGTYPTLQLEFAPGEATTNYIGTLTNITLGVNSYNFVACLPLDLEVPMDISQGATYGQQNKAVAHTMASIMKLNLADTSLGVVNQATQAFDPLSGIGDIFSGTNPFVKMAQEGIGDAVKIKEIKLGYSNSYGSIQKHRLSMQNQMIQPAHTPGLNNGFITFEELGPTLYDIGIYLNHVYLYGYELNRYGTFAEYKNRTNFNFVQCDILNLENYLEKGECELINGYCNTGFGVLENENSSITSPPFLDGLTNLTMDATLFGLIEFGDNMTVNPEFAKYTNPEISLG